MTLEELLGNSKLTPEEVSENLEYKAIKNSISEWLSDSSRRIMDQVSSLVTEVARDDMYMRLGSYYPCGPEQEKIAIPEEDKRILLISIYKKAKKSISRILKDIETLSDVKDDDDKEEKKINIEVSSPVEKIENAVAPVIQAVSNNQDMFGY